MTEAVQEVRPSSAFWDGRSSPAGTNPEYFVGDFTVNRITFP